MAPVLMIVGVGVIIALIAGALITGMWLLVAVAVMVGLGLLFAGGVKGRAARGP